MNDKLKEYVQYRHSAEQHAYQGLIVSLMLIGIATSKELKVAGFNIADGGLHNGYVAAFGGWIVAVAFARFYSSFREARSFRELLLKESELDKSFNSDTDRFLLRAPFSYETQAGSVQKIWMSTPFCLFAIVEILFTFWLFFFFTVDGSSVSWLKLVIADWTGFSATWKFQSKPVYLNTPFHTWIQLGLTAWIVWKAWKETRAIWRK